MSFISSILQDLPGFLLSLPVILIALSTHEAAHAFAAYKLGDPTAKNLGRLTLNPMKHLDPIGAVCMVLFHFGWAKPVPINARYFKDPRKGMALSALAGPCANLILGFLGVLLSRIYVFLAFRFGWFAFTQTGTLGMNAALIVYIFLSLFAQLNVSLAVFNLIPIPPLDGSRFLFIFLPPKMYFGLMKYERYIQIALLICLWLGLLTFPLSFLVDKLLDGMEWLVSFIPN